MSDSVHGHDVMALMVAQATPVLKVELLSKMSQTFGENARYHTCSAENLTAEELIIFLMGKGKLTETTEGISLAGMRCNHSNH
ncbi:YecH family protein [Shewanella sp. A25]|nr:YecH family protein [Shewanella shenzhenensis]